MLKGIIRLLLLPLCATLNISLSVTVSAAPLQYRPETAAFRHNHNSVKYHGSRVEST
jgi:hypothetical protein